MATSSDFYTGTINEALRTLQQESNELYLTKTVPVVHDLTPFNFYRKHVSMNLPIVIKGGCANSKAVATWNSDFLRNKFGEKEFNVAVTPNGYADAITSTEEDAVSKEYFVMPEEEKMKFSNFLDIMDEPERSQVAVDDFKNGLNIAVTRHKGIYYLQSQNNNLNQHFPELIGDIGSDLPWASEAFDDKPDAVNFWMGDCRAVTSMHKDPYENLYCVISGYKDFVLLPPTDRPWIPHKMYPKAVYSRNKEGSFDIVPCGDPGEKIPWICIDPLDPDIKTYPQYRYANPIHVRVNAGDVLYLPSLWFHHVRQSHACIAVNYWYDMQYDIKYAYYQMLDHLSSQK